MFTSCGMTRHPRNHTPLPGVTADLVSYRLTEKGRRKVHKHITLLSLDDLERDTHKTINTKVTKLRQQKQHQGLDGI